jgi:GNAT superfamily N-acetyltransferase
VAIVEQGRLLAYMVTGKRFRWKGQQAALVPEYGHAAVLADRPALYQRLYMRLAQQWADERAHLHLIRHLAHDGALQETLYQLGFGAILAERLRDLAPVPRASQAAIVEEREARKLVELHMEHTRYYPTSPIFIHKSADEGEALAELEDHLQQGDALLTYYERQQPCAYFIVGESAVGAEGFLLQRTNTAQIKSAYARPEARSRGIGAALLQNAVEWARQRGYACLFVEHETANVYGGNFWRKHFAPYAHFSMRYIDNTIGGAA